MKYRYRINPSLLYLVGLLGIYSPVNANLMSDLTIEITGFGERRGQLCFSLFSSSQGFPDSKKDAIESECVKITNNPMRVTFNNLPSKTYAVAVFLDHNEDGKLNRNFMGIPTEKFGFSSNPVIKSGPPKFGESAILVVGRNMNIKIKLQSIL
ncbi:DUF2141 domain-containing protein [Cyanobacterium sp. uoEpiScrs1]|uniref:DUF2141 domain-containing protein n=1 Tax=Cyanobacterium sp. uoEpiScrs1 TaxID=2976343 RepID=UPI00226A6729|nr:DUF2141 domain-containing protein [Cyanobacterium sp. uoEpiScrs1]